MHQHINKQRGISLIEALVALVILAVGVLGLAGVQARQLVETRTANSRAMAVRLVEDLNERMQLNVATARNGGYTLAFNATPTGGACTTSSCNAAQLAASDLAQWKANVTALLPGGNAAIFRNNQDPRQIGVMLAWNANEGKANSNAALNNAAYTAPFVVEDAPSTAAGATCPANAICHLVYLQP